MILPPRRGLLVWRESFPYDDDEKHICVHLKREPMMRLFATLVVLSTFLGAGVALDKPYHAFDYFIFSLQWPGTICSSHSSCCKGLSSASGFTIHGLWPEYNGGSWPQCCNGSSFDDNVISTLRSKLERFWPSLYCGSSSGCHKTKISFWGHEWEKHGTCASPVIQTEYDYFSIALQVYEKYDLLASLIKDNITPAVDVYYNTSSVVTVIAETLGAVPTLVCSEGCLKEIRLCFMKDFKPRDCSEVAKAIHKDFGSASSSCNKQLLIPPVASLEYPNSSVSY